MLTTTEPHTNKENSKENRERNVEWLDRTLPTTNFFSLIESPPVIARGHALLVTSDTMAGASFVYSDGSSSICMYVKRNRLRMVILLYKGTHLVALLWLWELGSCACSPFMPTFHGSTVNYVLLMFGILLHVVTTLHASHQHYRHIRVTHP